MKNRFYNTTLETYLSSQILKILELLKFRIPAQGKDVTTLPSALFLYSVETPSY